MLIRLTPKAITAGTMGKGDDGDRKIPSIMIILIAPKATLQLVVRVAKGMPLRQALPAVDRGADAHGWMFLWCDPL